MKTLRVLLAFIMVVACLMPMATFAEEEELTVTFEAKLSRPIDFPEGFGLLIKGVNSAMTYTKKVLKNEVLDEGDIPTIQFLGDAITFEGWDKSPIGHKVTEDITFTADFTVDEKAVPVFFSVERAKTSQSEGGRLCGLVAPGTHGEANGFYTYTAIVKEGEKLTEATIPMVLFPVGTMYEFVGWNNEPTETAITKPTEFVFTVWPIHRVGFIAELADFSELQFVREDSAAVPPTIPSIENYLFIGWDKDYSKVITDMEIYAIMFEYGDANMDEIVNTADAVTVLKACAVMIELDENASKLADVTADNTVNTADAVKILRKVAGM